MESDVLREEREFYLQSRAELLNKYEGKFVLIKNRELLGTYDTLQSAYAEGVKRLGNVPMLVVRVQTEDPVVWFPALQLGLISARLES